MSSKKHRENELKGSSKSIATHSHDGLENPPALKKEDTLTQKIASVAEEEEEETQAIDEKIAAARTRLSTSDCLFCPSTSASLEENLTHMSLSHSFFVPDADYLVDLPGLITYLGEKIAVGNVCIFCNAKSREFRTLEAVRKHMSDKSHCKIAYDTQDDRLEISDFYDFSGSYPDAESRKSKEADDAGDEWEDVEDDGPIEQGEAEESDEESLPDNQITYGDTEYELVLPSGARIGHRSMRRYYAQSFHLTPRSEKDADSGVALVRRLLADKNSALVPRKGGFGAFGMGTEVVKARNAGEARNAGRHIREYRDQRRREQFKTQVAFKHNHQKHYRDPRKSPLLSYQVLELNTNI